MQSAKRLIIAVVTITGLIGTAHAATLYTQPLFANNNQLVVCKVANVSPRPREITITIVQAGIGPVDTGTSTVAAGNISTLSEMGEIAQYYCKFDIKGGKATVRAGITISDFLNDLVAAPAN